MASGFRLTDPREYRRGVVLGLTLAEVLILLVFLLLLSSSALLAHRDREVRAVERKIAHYETAMAPLLEKLQSAGLGVSDTDELVSRLERARDYERIERELQASKSALAASEEAAARSASALTELRSKMDSISGNQKILAAKAADDDAVAALLVRADVKGESNVDRLRAVIERASQQTLTDQYLTGQNAQMRSELNRLKGNGGSGLPFCWTTIDGHPIYMLRIELRDDGVIVRELIPRPNPGDKAWPLLDSVPRDVLMPVTSLLAATAALQASAVAMKCRYGVLAFDGTARTNKPGYKSLMGHLWSAFMVRESGG